MLIDNKLLLAAIQKSVTVANTKTTVPITSCLKVTATGGNVTIESTNLENYLKVYTCNLENSNNVNFCVNGKLFLDVVKELNGVVLIEQKENKIKIQNNSFKCSLSTYDIQDFPVYENNYDKEINLLANDISMLCKSADFYSTDITRGSLAGVLFQCDGKYIKMVSTNGSLLSEVKIHTNNTEPFKIVLNPKSIEILEQLIKQENNNVSVRFNQKFVMFKTQNFELQCKLIESNYPKYENVLPENKNILFLNKFTLAAAFKRISSFSNKAFFSKFIVENGVVSVSAESKEYGSEATEIIGNYPDAIDIILGVDYSNMLRILNKIPTDNIVFTYSNSVTGIVIYPDDESINELYLIMPLRLRDEQ